MQGDAAAGHPAAAGLIVLTAMSLMTDCGEASPLITHTRSFTVLSCHCVGYVFVLGLAHLGPSLRAFQDPTAVRVNAHRCWAT